MVPIPSLWLAIVLSAVIVFVLSAILHMMLPFHLADHKRLPAEDATMDALRGFNIPPGDYMVPCPADRSAMRSPEFLDKLKKGPLVVMTVMRSGRPNMGPQLVQWFGYCLVVGVFAAYIAGRALGRGASYLSVFRFAGCTAFAAYTLALWQQSIWYKRSWGTTIRYTIDGLIYGLMTGGTFGWLWPK